jgi:hypothetical protein
MKSQDNNGYSKGYTAYGRRCTACRVLCTFLLLFFFSLCRSQETESPLALTYQSTLLGVAGKVSVYDTYLSPLKYTGSNLGLYYEQMKPIGWMNGRLSVQHLFTMNYTWSKNKPETASYYNGLIEYNYGLYYGFKPAEKLQVFAGTQAGGLLGFVYNTRNGNNPATGKAHLNLSLSAMAAYQLKIKSQPVHFRYQLNLPFAGIMYAPHFGQSYYEIGLGNTNDLIHFASFHNYLSIRNMLSVEIPMHTLILRLAYSHTLYETRKNDLDTQLNLNMFYIGFSKNFFVVSKKQSKNNYRYVFE